MFKRPVKTADTKIINSNIQIWSAEKKYSKFILISQNKRYKMCNTKSVN